MMAPGILAMRAAAEAVRTGQRERWAAARVARLPARWRSRMLEIHAEMLRGSEFGANSWLRETSEEFQALRIDPAATDDEIRALAASCALEAFNHATAWATGLGIPCGAVSEVRRKMGDYCRRWGVEPPDGCRVEDLPAVSRMTCASWWRRQLRRVQARGVEGAAIRLGYVHRRADLYVSEEAVARRREQRARNAAAMAATELENEAGDRYTLEKLAALSVANPRIRRGELMVRIAGFEACARAAGHAGEFVTVSCPSRMHARLAKSGGGNPRHDGTTPKQAQSHLVTCWARARAWMARRGVAVYGFRVAEPHHDGCPHWHLLVFMPPEHVGLWREAVDMYFRAQHDGDEAGARENRCKFVAIDWSRGTAAGYVAKYVSKNIDGADVGLDLEGRPAVESALRVDAWASTWGIRQFQQVGGPSVGLWRELRRLPECPEVPELEAMRRAAGDAREQVKPDFSRFVDLLGGPIMLRRDRPAAVATVGREGLNQYGERRGVIPYGVVLASGEVVKSRRHEWRIVGQGAAVSEPEREAAREHSLRILRELRRGQGRTVGSFFDDVVMGGAGWSVPGFGVSGAGEARAPWSPVNNCTGVSDADVWGGGVLRVESGKAVRFSRGVLEQSGGVGTAGAPDHCAEEIRVCTDGGPGDGRAVRRAAN